MIFTRLSIHTTFSIRINRIYEKYKTTMINAILVWKVWKKKMRCNLFFFFFIHYQFTKWFCLYFQHLYSLWARKNGVRRKKWKRKFLTCICHQLLGSSSYRRLSLVDPNKFLVNLGRRMSGFKKKCTEFHFFFLVWLNTLLKD